MINELEHELEDIKKDLGCSDDNFEQHILAKKTYLSNLEQPDPVVEMKKQYIRALCELVKAR